MIDSDAGCQWMRCMSRSAVTIPMRGRRRVRTTLAWDDGARAGVVRRVFFFQAEDGIRDLTVTGVQTCALPIFSGGAIRFAISYGAPYILTTARSVSGVTSVYVWSLFQVWSSLPSVLS